MESEQPEAAPTPRAQAKEVRAPASERPAPLLELDTPTPDRLIEFAARAAATSPRSGRSVDPGRLDPDRAIGDMRRPRGPQATRRFSTPSALGVIAAIGNLIGGSAILRLHPVREDRPFIDDLGVATRTRWQS